MDEVKRGELYYADLSPVVGSEQGGIRPVLILQNDKTNQNSTTTIVAAMTSQIKNNLQTHVKVSGHGLKKESLVLLEQIRTIDKVRLMQYIGRLGDKDMKKIDRALTESLSIKNSEVFQVDNMNCAFYYEVNLLQILLREGYISETDYHAIVSIAEDDLKATLYLG